ncbi:TolC family protein [Mucilaginibacter rubeus]|uniref:TolC family protein n=1 Tax=Mucilaginibacter rubeus TaxID=2027860 RepID=A0AAE6JCI8_9SPHI|nr:MULTISPECIES: TolC family protein [Mucilaginibacter]QEM03070.1 TolC family protein [Mucilaginibacter rubeus]QEM15689.1 TolC family protein [Mucilaginibacter gossypii]QTE41575.1 TolC family protein [Mucilaginibacter rubeus]QTE48181.1 TolC family protein [Mucilaginibacter rubeus]QTE59571.1 TolC family protein [Mucilaginibacter rubeus]
MKKTPTFIFFLSAMFLHVALCKAQVNLTLRQTIDSALRRNLQLKRSQVNQKIASAVVLQSRYNLLPTLTANPQLSFNWGRTLDVSTYNYVNQRVFLTNGTLGSQVTLFQGGVLRNQILQNKILLEAENSALKRNEYELTIAAMTAFFQILASEELLNAAREQVRLAKLNVEKMQRNFDLGNKTSTDIAQIRAQQANTESDQASIENQLEVSILNLRQLINIDEDTLILKKPDVNKIKDLWMHMDTSELIDKSIKLNPSIQEANYQKRAAYVGVQVAKSSYYPTLILYGQVGTNYSNARTLTSGYRIVGFDTIGITATSNEPVLSPSLIPVTKKYRLTNQLKDNFYQAAGLTLQIPIVNHFTARINVKKAQLAYYDAVLANEIVVSNFKKVFKQALADLKSARKKLAAAVANVTESKQVLFASDKRYQIGLLNALDYETAVSNFNRAQFQEIQARYDLIFKQKLIEFYIGEQLDF